MKMALPMMTRTVAWLRNLVAVSPSPEAEDPPAKSRSEGIPSLYEFQHQVILGIFRIGIAGFCAFFVVLVSFTLFSYFDPSAPRWVAYTMVLVGGLLLYGFYRTLQEFKTYLETYAAISTLLRDKTLARGAAKARPKESRVLSVLKPREHRGWDAKVCRNCQKSIELLATVCQHCGHEHQQVLVN